MTFESQLKTAKLRLLKMHMDAGVGHIGGNLSCIDAVLYLHLKTLTLDDVFILSKGHSAGALYISLWAKGLISEEQLLTFHKDNTLLAGHPVAGWNEGIRFGTGSLGHGCGLSCGIALAKKLKKAPGQVYCLLSDGELQEGSNWEALIFLSHHKLTNLTLLIDENGLQGFGKTNDISSLQSLTQLFSGFNLFIVEINGHNAEELEEALSLQSTFPKIIVLKTIKGHGVSFMENKMESHYLPLTPEQYSLAVQELSKP
jgi:transketolase